MSKFIYDVDLNQNQLQNAVIQSLSAAPSNPKEGQIYYDTTDKNIYRFDGTNWVTYQAELSTTEAGTLSIDSTPTSGSNNLVTSGGIYTAIQNVDALPSQSGQNGKFLTTDGTDASWATVSVPVQSVNSKTGNVVLTASDVGALSDDTVIPSKTSELTNDSDFVEDANYVHTDNNFTGTLKDKLDGIAAGATVDDHKWNNVSLNKSFSSSSNNFYVPFLSATTSTTAQLALVTNSPNANRIAKYDASAYLKSTTPAADDNSTKVATTAYVKTAVDNNKSNWNANNDEAGYILNRPFYSETVQNGTINIVSPFNYVTVEINDSIYNYNFTVVDGPDNTFRKDYYEYLKSLYGKGYPGPISLYFRNSDITYTSTSGDVSGWEGNYRSSYYLTGTDATITIDVFYDGNDSYESSAYIVSPANLRILDYDYVDLTVTVPTYSETIHKLDNKYLNLDTTLSSTSTNPVQNSAIKSYIDSHITSAPVTSVNSKTGAVVLTAADVGALPTTTSIPSATSDLTNDSGFITSSDVPSASSTTPVVDGTATTGVETSWARGDHVHPTDATRQAKITASGILKGDGQGGVTAAIAGTDYVAGSELFHIIVTDTNDTLTADKTYAQIQTAISEGKELIVTKDSYTFKQHFYVASNGCVFTGIGYNNNGPNEVILTVDPQDNWTFFQSQATCASIGALPISGGTMTGQLTTSFGAVAMGTIDGGNRTLPELAQILRYSNGVAGSFYLTTAYEINQWGVNIPVSWYNFFWIPHRTGGLNGAASGDNCDYGALYLADMTGDNGIYEVRFTNQAIANVRRLDNVDAGSWTQPTYTYRGVNYAIDWTIGSGTTGGVDANGITGNYCGYYTSNGPSTAIGASTGDGALWTQAYSSVWMCQIAGDYRNGNLFVRGKNNGTFTAWKKLGANTTITVSLPVASWNTSTKQISVSASGVTASNLVEVSPAPASWSVASAAGVYCSAQGANSLTFTCSSIPTAAITVNVVIWG